VGCCCLSLSLFVFCNPKVAKFVRVALEFEILWGEFEILVGRFYFEIQF
jgi:hypothetical protein